MSNQETRPLRTCDIVMKGGITSGVVYPRAITTLARRYVFKNIGGTSAGAIAAAAAAAAEFRRSLTGGDEGFQRLGQLPDLLGEKAGAGGRTRLFQFFQPNTKTRRVFDVLTSVLGSESKGSAFVCGVIRKYPGWALAGTVPGWAFGILTGMDFADGCIVWAWLMVSLLLLLAGGMISPVAGLVVDIIREIPRNNYGLCSGLSDPQESAMSGKRSEALTVWLTAYLNETAGLPADAAPLTFGKLWKTQESDQDKAQRLVNLEMVTTNLTHGRPYRLPFRDDDDLRENHLFYFRADEFKRLFPEPVVQWMLDHPRDGGGNAERLARRARLKDKGFHPLPAPADLPVVVATRMSLSFPILLSAVPLHAIDRSVFPENEQPERCWFSDGGMCSNFPLHFFDAALPRRPTFSIDLTQKPLGTPKHELRPEMPHSNGGEISDRWNRFDTDVPTRIHEQPAAKSDLRRLLGLFSAMIATMQNWTDATQGRLPGFRDRIVSVPLTPDEGGLNLDMPPQRIADLSERGVKAAELLDRHYDVPLKEETMTWDNHRWIRLRSFLASLEKSLNQLVNACDHPENGDRSYEQWLVDLAAAAGPEEVADDDKAPSYPLSPRQLVAARKTLAELRAIHELWAASPAAGKAPRPRPVLRPRPQI